MLKNPVFSYITKGFGIPIILSGVLFSYVFLYLFYIDHYWQDIYVSPSEKSDWKTSFILWLYHGEAIAKWVITPDELSNIPDYRNDSTKQYISTLSGSHIYFPAVGTLSFKIAKLGIHEPVFVLPVANSHDEFYALQKSKLDPDSVNMEIADRSDVLEWFLLSWHSSGWSWDRSRLKNVFNSLGSLDIGDSLSVFASNWDEYDFSVISRKIVSNEEPLPFPNRFYVFTCYPNGTSDKRLVYEFKFIGKIQSNSQSNQISSTGSIITKDSIPWKK